MFLCSGFSSWNLRSPVAFPSLSKIFAVYPRLSKGFLESEGRGQEAKLLLKAFSTSAKHGLSCLFMRNPKRVRLQLFYELRKKTLKQQFAWKRVSKPDGKKGQGEECTGSVSACNPLGLGP